MGENSNNSMKYQLHGCTDNGNLVTQDTCPPLKASNVKNQSGVQAYHNRINHLSESGNPVTENNTNDEEGRTYNEDNVADRSRRAILSKYPCFDFAHFVVLSYVFLSVESVSRGRLTPSLCFQRLCVNIMCNL